MQRRFALWLLGLIAFFGLILLIGALYYSIWNKESPTTQAIQKKLNEENRTLANFQLNDPNLAPEKIRELVELGFRIMIETAKYAPEYAGNGKMSCTNCHFAGGNTTGGKNGSISLAGVAGKYPTFFKSDNNVVNLATRINSCFEKSLNGKSLPPDSKEMLALETYFHWISKGLPIYEEIPWLGLPSIATGIPNPMHGKKIYYHSCAPCHGKNGEGKGIKFPPLWGPDSFNQDAGMNNPKKFASFTYLNMPYNDASLSIQEACDVTDFVLKQPRPEGNSK